MKFHYTLCRMMIDDSWETKDFYIKKGSSPKTSIRKLASKSLEALKDDLSVCVLVFCKKTSGFFPISIAYNNPEEAGILLEGCTLKKVFNRLDEDTLGRILSAEIRSHLEKKDRKDLGRND